MAGYRSQDAFAKALGVSKSTLSKYLRLPDWPAKRKPPFSETDLDRARSWRAILREDRSGKAAPPAPAVGAGGGGGDINLKELDLKTKIRLTEERRRRAKVDADMAEQAVVPREVLDRALVGLARIFIERWRSAAASLPRQLTGKPSADKATLQAYADRVCRDLVESAQIQLATADDELLQAARKKTRNRARSTAGGGGDTT